MRLEKDAEWESAGPWRGDSGSMSTREGIGRGKKVERKYFEEELRALQDDISYLSRKLSLPISSTNGGGKEIRSSYGGTGSESDDGGRGRGRQRNGYDSDPIDQLSDHRHYIESESDTGHTSSEHPRGQLARLKKEVRTLTRERDDALYQIQQLQHENQQLQQQCEDRYHLKSTCEHLLHDVESLKISLQSSESIRKQQKELLLVLQRGQSLIDSSRHHSIPHLQQSQPYPHQSEETSVTSSGHHSSHTAATGAPVVIPQVLSSPTADHHRQTTRGSSGSSRSLNSSPSVTSATRPLTRRKATPATPSSALKSSPVSGLHSTPRHKPTKTSTPTSAAGASRTPRFTSRSPAAVPSPSSDSDTTSSRHSLSRPRGTRHQHATPLHSSASHRSPSPALHTPPSMPSRPPLAPHSNTSSRSHHIPFKTSPLGTSKVKSRPQSAPPASSSRSNGRSSGSSFLNSYYYGPGPGSAPAPVTPSLSRTAGGTERQQSQYQRGT